MAFTEVTERNLQAEYCISNRSRISKQILKRWILKILPDRNCSTGEGARTESRFTKSSERSRKKAKSAWKSSQQHLSICQSNRCHPLRVNITQVASGLHSSLWKQPQGHCRNTLRSSAHLKVRGPGLLGGT